MWSVGATQAPSRAMASAGVLARVGPQQQHQQATRRRWLSTAPPSSKPAPRAAPTEPKIAAPDSARPITPSAPKLAPLPPRRLPRLPPGSFSPRTPSRPPRASGANTDDEPAQALFSGKLRLPRWLKLAIAGQLVCIFALEIVLKWCVAPPPEPPSCALLTPVVSLLNAARRNNRPSLTTHLPPFPAFDLGIERAIDRLFEGPPPAPTPTADETFARESAGKVGEGGARV